MGSLLDLSVIWMFLGGYAFSSNIAAGLSLSCIMGLTQ